MADRKLTGQWAGEIYFNHGPRSRYFNRDSAYILQDDLFYATLTVRECIFFAASFHLPDGTSPEAINARIDELLELMSLTHIQDSIVGDEIHKGISGGQRKRLSIAVEIVALPNLIFLDEPTSGLDSSMAYEVIQAVKQLAEQNRTCVATIHQPSPEVFALFDKLILLCEGKLVYAGPVDQVVEYFSSAPLNFFYDENQTNAAEFLIDITEGIIRPIDRRDPFTNNELVECYSKSKHRYVPPSKQALEKGLQKVEEEEENNETVIAGVHTLIFDRRHATRKLTQFHLITKRNCLAIIRDIPEISAQLMKNVIVGCLIGTIFFQQAIVETPLFDENGVPNPEVQNISSLLFFR
jgi:ABC-type multidrug transport system ATPase subunit